MSAIPVSTVAAAAVAGTAVAVPAAVLPAHAGIAAAGTVLCGLGFVLWPWAVLPIGIIGGSIASGLLGATDVRTFVVLHTLPLMAGCAALVVRRILLPTAVPARPSPSGVAMAGLAIATAVAAVYGLALGNQPWNVLVAAYQVAVIPAYYFLATCTLDTPRRLRAAAICYLSTIAVLTAIEIATPGRHGGLLSALAVPPLMVLVGRTRGWQRAGLVLLTALFIADVVLASYRGIWLAAGVAVLIMLLRGGRVVRRGVLATVAGAVLLLGAISLHSGVRDRSSAITVALQRDSGYRVPESAVGLDAFASQPLLGAGLGQSTPQVYVNGFTVTDVGPVYHAFWVMILANLGLLGLIAVLWPVARTLRTGLAQHNGLPLAFAALTCGFLGAAFFAGPTDGHWELGLLPALTMLTSRFQSPLGHGGRRPDTSPCQASPTGWPGITLDRPVTPSGRLDPRLMPTEQRP
ncbi:O-antigen ligase family protein [Plantactinospora sp. DSM 117369]